MAELEDLVARVVGWARPGEEVEAYASWERELSVRVFEGGIEHLVSAESSGIGVRVIAGGKQGFAYAGSLGGPGVRKPAGSLGGPGVRKPAGSLDEALLTEVLEEARDNATWASVDEYLGLASPDGVEPADLDLWRDSVGSMATSAKVDLALALDKAVRSGDSRIRQVESSNYADAAWESAIASTAGVAVAQRGTGAYLFSYAIAEEEGDTRTGGGYSVGREPSELDVDEAATDAVSRATRLLGAVKPRSGRVRAVLDPRVASSFLSILAGTLSGEAVEKGRSLFAGRLGEVVADTRLTLCEDPTDPRGYLASRYDAEGLSTRRTLLIEEGVLKNFLYDTYSARRAGTTSTASASRAGFASTPGVGFRAVSARQGEASQDEIVSRVGEGILVTSITGVHSGVNPVSGDFSVGAEGMMIRDGVIGEPVKEATIASTLQRMLLSLVGVGADLEWLPGPTAGVTLAIDDVYLSGA